MGELASRAAGLMAGIGALPLLFIRVASQRLSNATLGFATGVDARCQGIRTRPAWHRGGGRRCVRGSREADQNTARQGIGVFVDFLAEALVSASTQRC